MLKWRRVSAGGCWEISLTMRWLRRTHSHTNARFITCWGLVSLAAPVQSHHLNSFKCGLIEANFVTSKVPSMNGGCHRRHINRGTDLCGSFWKVCCRLHMPPINMLQVLMVTRYICDEHAAETGFLNVSCSLIWGVQVVGMAVVRMFASTMDHSSQRALCVFHSCSTLRNYIYEVGWCHYVLS